MAEVNVRFQQILLGESKEGEDVLYGLSIDGTVYERVQGNWNKIEPPKMQMNDRNYSPNRGPRGHGEQEDRGFITRYPTPNARRGGDGRGNR